MSDARWSRAVDRAVLALSGVSGITLAILWWGTVLLLGRPRFQDQQYFLVVLVRPDWLLGQAIAPDAVLFDILHYYVPAVLLAIFAYGLWRVLRGDWATILTLALLAAAGLSYLLVSAFPDNPALYQDSPVRGIAGGVFTICLPAAVVMAGVASRRSGWLGAGVWSLVGGTSLAWGAVLVTSLSALGGAHQPQLSGAIVVQALGSIWYLGMGAWLLALGLSGTAHQRTTSGRQPARILRRAGGGLAIVGVVILMASCVLSGVILGPTMIAQVSGRTQTASLDQGVFARSYRIYRPARVAVQPGLIIVLHGAYGDGYQMEVVSGFDGQADRLGWIIAYPDGVADGWDTFGDTPSWGQHPGVNDVLFISALIDQLRTTDHLDANRIYVTGLSRGGMMSYRLGCELSSQVAAIAPVSGNMATTAGSAVDVQCQPDRPVSVLAIHGTADPRVPIDGGLTDINYAPLSDVMLKWRQMNRCSDSSTVSVSGPSTTTSWGCAQGSTVAMRVVAGGIHAWPGSLANGIVEPNVPDRSFDASSVIADFFQAHPRVAAPA